MSEERIKQRIAIFIAAFQILGAVFIGTFGSLIVYIQPETFVIDGVVKTIEQELDIIVVVHLFLIMSSFFIALLYNIESHKLTLRL